MICTFFQERVERLLLVDGGCVLLLRHSMLWSERWNIAIDT